MPGRRSSPNLRRENDGILAGSTGNRKAVAGLKTAADLRFCLERTTGFEPATPTLARWCSTN
jgi:hypothetical protein